MVRLIIFLFCASIAHATGAGAVIPRDRWVDAASGSDSNPGTGPAPWATLAKCSAAALSPDAIVYLKGTFYNQQLAPTSSGTSGHPIVYKTWGSTPARLSGGVLVTTWTLVDAPNNIWRASFSAASGRPRAIWVNDLRCSRNRTTSIGSFSTNATGWNSTLLATAALPTEAEIHALFAFWSVKFVQVSAATGSTISVTPAVKAILVEEESLFNSVGGSSLPYEVENWYEHFVSDHTQATFFQDRTNNFIYLVPPTGVANPNSATVVAGVRENVLTLTSLHDVTISDIEVRHTTSARPYHADAAIDAQTGGFAGTDFDVVPVSGGNNWQGTLTTQAAAVMVDASTRIAFDRTVICSTSNTGLKIRGASDTVDLGGIIILDTGGANLDVGDPLYLYNQNNTSPIVPQVTQPTAVTLHDSYLRRAGRDFISSPNIISWYGTSNTYSYNVVRDSNYSNMAMGWGFGYYEPSVEGGDLIERNEVYNGMGLLDDGAGIYLNGVNETTRTARFNYVHDITGTSATTIGKAGLYLDGGAFRNDVHDNVVVNAQVYVWNLNSDNNGSVKDMPRSAPLNFLISTTANSSSTRGDGSLGSNTTAAPTVLSTGAAQAAGVALGTGPRATYSDVLTRAAALVF